MVLLVGFPILKLAAQFTVGGFGFRQHHYARGGAIEAVHG